MSKTAFGDNTMEITQMFKWFSQFKNVETSVGGCRRARRPTTSRSTHGRALNSQNPKQKLTTRHFGDR